MHVREERRAVEDVGEERAAHGVAPGALLCFGFGCASGWRKGEESEPHAG